MSAHQDGRECPKCGGPSRVDRKERLLGEIRRYRVCLECAHHFVTHQPIERFVRDVRQQKDSAGGMSQLTGVLRTA